VPDASTRSATSMLKRCMIKHMKVMLLNQKQAGHPEGIQASRL
jgi:hypothetical protein